MLFGKKNTHGNSWVHQLDPRLKIVIAFLTTFLIALTNDLVTLAYFLFLAIIGNVIGI